MIQTIREGFQNVAMQLFVTGEPSASAVERSSFERSLIDRYDIDGYLTKADLTEDKLFTMVKRGLRHYMAVDWHQRIRFFC